MGSLLPYGSTERPGLIDITLNNGATVRGVLQKLEIPEEKVKLIFVNHTGTFLGQQLKNGDRVSLFPAEYPVFADWKESILSQGDDEEGK